MCFARTYIALLLSLVFTISVFPQQTATTKDPQALSVTTQALNAAGGIQAISTIDDYTATGTVTYFGPDNVSGPVVIRESGLSQLRIDSELSTGPRSQAIDGGEITVRVGGVSARSFEQGPMYPGCVVLPNLFLAMASMANDFALRYKGTVTIDGHPAHDIQVQRVLSTAVVLSHPEVLTTELFIDATTFRVIMTKDSDAARDRQIHYTDYRAVNGVFVPFGISEWFGANQTWSVQLSRVEFNTGLQNSDFKL